MPQVQKRMTRQRAVILEELRKSCSHPTADEIYACVRARLPHISLGTVYRNLELLAENGEVMKLEHAGSLRRFDGNMQPHRHVRCSFCGRVADVFVHETAPDVEGLTVPGFTITGARVEYEGICAECAALENTGGTRVQ